MFKRNFPLIGWIILVIYIIYGTTIPFDFSLRLEDIIQRISRANYIPFYNEYTHRRVSIPDVISNLLLFIPYGFLLYWGLQNKGISRGKSKLICVFSAFVFSSFIEFLQLFSAFRTSSITDVINNIFGAYIGCILSNRFLLSLKDKFFEQLNILRQKNPFLLFLIPYSLLILLGFMFPFDISIDVGDIKHSLKNTNLIPFYNYNHPFINTGLNLFPFIIFGFIGYAALRRYSSNAIFNTIFLGVGLAVLIEICQIFIVSRFTDISEVIIRGIGVLLGISMAFINFYRK